MRNFEELIQSFQPKTKRCIAVVNAADKVTLQAVFDLRIKPYLTPILIGESHAMNAALAAIPDVTAEDYTFIPADSEEEAAAIGVKLAVDGTADALMKGHIQTRPFLKAVVNKETGIVAESLLSHAAVNQLPGYHKLLLTTDGGMVAQPQLDQKRKIILHAIQVMQQLGISKPKVALLAAAETVNPSIQSSVEARQLMEEFQQAMPQECWIDGPLSLDLAISPKSVEMKHYHSAVAGDADILVGPDITVMNVLGKSMTTLAGGQMAGVVIGATVPIVLTSRGSDHEEKVCSIALAMHCSQGGLPHEDTGN